MPNLPAPYVSPWRELGRNLRAALADLRLRLQRLWRRNREGDLPIPDAWPQDLAPWFWPLLLALSLVLTAALVALVVQGTGLMGQKPQSPAQGADPVVLIDPIPADGPRSSPTEADLLDGGEDRIPSDVVSPLIPPETDAFAVKLVEAEAVAETETEAEAVAEAEAEAEAVAEESPDPPGIASSVDDAHSSVERPADPLFQAMQSVAGSVDLVLETNAVVDLNRMVLIISSGQWTLLTKLERADLAAQWQDLVMDFGYGELRLVDQDDRPLGRSARVGEGMILFESETKA